MDIAALGLSVDSGPAERAVTALRQLPGAARAAAAGADQVAGAAERQARATTQSTAALGTNARAMQVSGSAMRAATASVNDNAKAMAGLGFQAKQTLVQLPDIIQGIASGQGVFRTAIQQGGQLVQIYGMGPGGVGGSLRQVGSELAATITPMRLLGVGVAAIGVAVVAGISSWKNYALALDDLSRITGTATTELSKLQTAASVKGIGQDEFAGGMRRFADAVYDAKAGTNDLATLLRLNGKTVSDTAGTLDIVANLIKNSRDDQQRLQILQQAGLPATMEWVRLLREGGDGLRAAKDGAAKFGGAVNDQMVMKAREFTEEWNKAWENFAVGARNSVTQAASWLQSMVDSATNLLQRVREAVGSGPIGTPADQVAFRFPRLSEQMRLEDRSQKTVRDASDLAAQQRDLQLTQQRISLLGDLASVTEIVAAKEKELSILRDQGARITATEAERIADLYQAQLEYSRASERLGTLGGAATDAEKYAVTIQGLSLKLKENKISQSDFNRAALEAIPIFASLKTGAEDAFASIISGVARGEDAFAALAQSISGIGDQLIKIGSKQLLDPLFAGVGGQAGGLLGGGLTNLLGIGSTLAGPVGGMKSARIEIFKSAANDNEDEECERDRHYQNRPGNLPRDRHGRVGRERRRHGLCA